jgi:hypothetical protein
VLAGDEFDVITIVDVSEPDGVLMEIHGIAFLTTQFVLLLILIEPELPVNELKNILSGVTERFCGKNCCVTITESVN